MNKTFFSKIIKTEFALDLYIKKPYKISKYLLIIAIAITTVNCKKDKPANPKPTETKLDAQALAINQFIWSGLNAYYLWVDNVPDLSTNKYSTQDALNAFLNKYPDHEKLFNSLLYTTFDKWSWIVDDYTSLENSFQGISKSMGYEFGLVRLGTTNDILGYVRYVIPNSPASKVGIRRGDIFIKIDNTQLTVSNYMTLLNKDFYSISFATISNNTLYPNNITKNLIADVVEENPILLDTVYDINGTNTGYLVYNGFMSNYDIKLNDVFADFKSKGVQQLILDLRYNPGGSGQSAKYLSSMIYGTDTTKIFMQTKYNNELQAYLLNLYGNSYFTEYFADKITNEDLSKTSINCLQLTKLYVITSEGTASSSELVINCLKPYIPVTLIGSTTVGKYVGSITIYDYDSTGVYNVNAGGKVNSHHKWAMQPIIVKTANSQGQTNYTNGFIPDVAVSEYDYIDQLLPLGDENEPLLKAALNHLQGFPQTKALRNSIFSGIADSKDFLPHAKEMYFKPFIKK